MNSYHKKVKNVKSLEEIEENRRAQKKLEEFSGD